MHRPILLIGFVILAGLVTTLPAHAELPEPRQAQGKIGHTATIGMTGDEQARLRLKAEQWPVDSNAVDRQAQRLRAVEARHLAGAGGTYLDPPARRLVVRYVDNPDGASLRAEVIGMRPRKGEVTVRLEQTTTSIHRLRAAVTMLNDSRSWAGIHASRVYYVSLDELALEIKIRASDAPEELARAAESATGFTPRVSVSGTVPGFQ